MTNLPRIRDDERAAAGVVGAIIALGAIVAFLAYVDAAWVPNWVEGKESGHAEDVSEGLATWATDAEDHVARAQTGRPWSVSLPLGVGGLPILGTGSSSGELSVVTAPSLVASVGGAPVVAAHGGLAMSTHTQRYPNQTYLYALGALEVSQSEGAWVDLRSLVSVARASNGETGLALQAIDLASAPQQAAGNGQAAMAGKLVSIAQAPTTPAGNVTLVIDHVQAGAWRAAFNRTAATSGLRAEAWTHADCQSFVASQAYCYPTANNTASRFEVVIYRVAAGWTAQVAQVAPEIRG